MAVILVSDGVTVVEATDVFTTAGAISADLVAEDTRLAVSAHWHLPSGAPDACLRACREPHP
jgi:hypothetical protein